MPNHQAHRTDISSNTRPLVHVPEQGEDDLQHHDGTPHAWAGGIFSDHIDTSQQGTSHDIVAWQAGMISDYTDEEHDEGASPDIHALNGEIVNQDLNIWHTNPLTFVTGAVSSAYNNQQDYHNVNEHQPTNPLTMPEEGIDYDQADVDKPQKDSEQDSTLQTKRELYSKLGSFRFPVASNYDLLDEEVQDVPRPPAAAGEDISWNTLPEAPSAEAQDLVQFPTFQRISVEEENNAAIPVPPAPAGVDHQLAGQTTNGNNVNETDSNCFDCGCCSVM